MKKIFLPILTLIIENISFLPILNPVIHSENFHFSIRSGADDAIKACIDNHLFADKTRKGVNRLFFSGDAAKDVYVASQDVHTCSGSVDNGVLFGMNAATQLVALAVRDIEFISQAKTMFKAIFGFSRSSNVSCGYDLVITDNDSAYRSAKTGAPVGYLIGNI